MHKETCGEYWQKSNLLVESGGERCYSSKETSLEGLVSEQSQIFFAYAIRRGMKVRRTHGEEVRKAILR